MRDDINNLPRWIWYTTMFLYQADKARVDAPDKSISQIYDDFLSHQDLQTSGFQIRNQGMSMMVAYGLLVLPREIWNRDDLPVFEFKTRSQFKFITDDINAMTRPSQFIRGMRNAISHAHVKIIVPVDADQEDAFTFWNYNPRTQKIDFKVSSSWIGFLSFIDEVAKYYINIVQPYVEATVQR